jgi:hypothetical protein
MDTFKSFRNTVLFGFFFLIVVVNSAQAQSPLEDLASLKNIASNYINTQSMDDKAIEINQWYGKLSNQAKVEIAKTGITAVNVVEKFSAMPPFVQNTLMQLGLSNEKVRFPLSKCSVQFTHPFVQFTLIVGSMVSSPY